MTYRDRREAKADRLRGWADKRDERGSAALSQAHEMAAIIPLGQPILVGHHSERGDRNYRSRIDSKYERGFADVAKAQEMRARAANIDAQAAHAIYSDDSDAIDRLRERIAGLEQERDSIKAYNASCRKGRPDESLLTDPQRGGLATARKYAPYQLGKRGEMPGYALSNLSGNISKQRARLLELETKAEHERIESLIELGEMVRCAAPNCRAVFYFVADAEQPNLCRDHAKTVPTVRVDAWGFGLRGYDSEHVRWAQS